MRVAVYALKAEYRNRALSVKQFLPVMKQKDYIAFHTVCLVYKYTLFYFVLDCVKQILTFNQYMSDVLFIHNINNIHDLVTSPDISQVARRRFLVAKATVQCLNFL
jgi:hypothetical protein